MATEEPTGRRKIDITVTQRVGPWQVALSWPDDPYQVGPVSVTITPADDAADDELIGGLSSTVLRQIDFPAARVNWQAEKVVKPRKRGEASATGSVEWATSDSSITEVRSKHLRDTLARDGVSDGYLALLAEAYVALVKAGERSVAGKLAEMTGRSPDTMKQHLHKVRKAGMLTSIPGKAGGMLTPAAVKAIREWRSGPVAPEAQWELSQQMAAKVGKNSESPRSRTET